MAARKDRIPPAELAKREGLGLRGELASEIANDLDHLTRAQAHLLKHHGVYQQDDRDQRRGGQKEYSYFVRSRLPGGRMTAQQFQCEVELCERFGNGTLRITDRQGVQLHGVAKSDLRPVIRAISAAKSTTWAACGDVVRNVMCCPAPTNSHLARELQDITKLVSQVFLPESRAYWELWLRDDDEPQKLAEGIGPEEPFYGDVYLPRKFKIGFATPDDNCIDVLTHDLGFVAVVRNGRLAGFNAYVGGGMALTPARQDTFAAIAQPLAYVTPGEVLALAKAVVATHRDHGNRSDRKLSRLRYLVADWGIEKFFAHVDHLFGGGLRRPLDQPIVGVHDHLGWSHQADGLHYLGLHVPNGRIQDTSNSRLKSGLAHVASRYGVEFRVTPQQNIILCGISDDTRAAVASDLQRFDVAAAPPSLPARREAMVCPALPTCGLAIAESERVVQGVLEQLETALRRYQLQDQPLSVRMTGCPNGCTRPYVAEIGIVGKSKDHYSVYLGGSRLGTRLGFLFQASVPLTELITTLEPVLALFAAQRNHVEAFGDFCHRVGPQYLLENLPVKMRESN